MGAQGSGPDTAGAGQVVERTVGGEFQEEVMLELRAQHRHDRVPSRGQESDAFLHHFTTASSLLMLG